MLGRFKVVPHKCLESRTQKASMNDFVFDEIVVKSEETYISYLRQCRIFNEETLPCPGTEGKQCQSIMKRTLRKSKTKLLQFRNVLRKGADLLDRCYV